MVFNYEPVRKMRITSHFGPRSTTIQGASKYHKGIDCVPAQSNTCAPLYLVADGTLVESSWNDYRGWFCRFRLQGSKYSVLYQHMKEKCRLPKGSVVSAGTIIGYMGASRSYDKIPKMAAHLHFELWSEQGIPIDPEPYLTNTEEYEVVKDLKIIMRGNTYTVKAIYKEGTNYIRMRDLEDVLHIVEVDYDPKKKMPVIS